MTNSKETKWKKKEAQSKGEQVIRYEERSKIKKTNYLNTDYDH